MRGFGHSNAVFIDNCFGTFGTTFLREVSFWKVGAVLVIYLLGCDRGEA